MGRRKPISTRTRFEVLKRDGFRCKYCGATALSSLLAVDHVIPVSKGGTDDPTNLITACTECNGGKSNVPLDASALEPGRDPDAIREHAYQIATYLDACRELDEAKEEFRQYIAEKWLAVTGEKSVAEKFVTRLINVIEQHGIAICEEAMSIVGERRLRGEQAHMYFNGIVRKKAANG